MIYNVQVGQSVALHGLKEKKERKTSRTDWIVSSHTTIRSLHSGVRDTGLYNRSG